MSLTQTHMIGQRFVNVTLTHEVEDMIQRLHLGDPTCGWLGDDTLDLRLAIPVDQKGNPTKGTPQFEVWGRTTLGEQYVCLRWPTCDPSMLKALAGRDTRRGASMEKVIKAMEADEAAKDKARSELIESIAERAQWALLRDTNEPRTHFGMRGKR